MGIGFLKISDISLYITSVSPYTNLIVAARHLRCFDSLNKHEQFQKSKRSAGVLHECFFKGNWLSSKKFSFYPIK